MLVPSTLALGALLLATACPPEDAYDVRIDRTEYGIPHVLAEDWGSLGYGYGFAFAEDNACILAREVVAARGEQSKFFGPGGNRRDEDFFWRYWASDAVVHDFFDRIGPELQELARGYAAGYNRFLRDAADELPDDCRGAPWVRPIDEFDLFRVYYKLVDRAGASNLVGFIADAAPPAPLAAASPADPAQGIRLASVSPEEFRRRTGLPQWKPEEIGSNMVGLGRDATADGRGMLLVNPHFPWTGPLRFYQVHLTIPGVIDSMGASISGSPLPNIGFNRNVAWSHTVSAADRFILRQLEIVPERPTSYVVDGQEEAMTPVSVEIEVLQPDGSLAREQHSFWDTRYGPVLVILPFVAWSNAAALAVEDVSRGNFRIFDEYLRMNLARDLDDFVAAVEEEVALPWVNTVAVDRNGEAWYGDVGTVPAVSQQLLDDCSTPASAFVESLGLFLLNGWESRCALLQDADSPQPGIFGPGHLPTLRRTDWVQNSNDSYWLTNPAAPLEGFSPLLGGERRPLSLRTRLGIEQIRERLAGSDGRPGNRFTLEDVQNLVTANRNFSAELVLDAVRELCEVEPHVVDVGGTPVDVGPACALLDAWSGRMDTDAVGAAIWRVAWPGIGDVPGLFAVPFDPADAAGTPRDPDLADPAVRSGVMHALAEAVDFLQRNGIPLDAPWGQVQFAVRGTDRIPIPGGPGSHGVYDAIGSGFVPGQGWGPVDNGSSIVMAVGFDADGPRVRGLLTYSQSSDPKSPHYGDQTRLFSREGWNDLPFTREEIDARSVLRIHLTEPRRQP